MAEMGPVWEGGNVFKGYKLQSGGKENAFHGKGKVGKFFYELVFEKVW